MENYQKLIKKLAKIEALRNSSAVLEWDLSVYMPPGGEEARANHLSVLQELAHHYFTDDETGTLIHGAQMEVEGMPYESDEASLVRIASQDYQDEIKLPSEFVAQQSHATTMAHHTWAKARENNDFSAFIPDLERIMELKQQEATYRGYDKNPYDALLSGYDKGINTAMIKAIFDGHKPQLISLIADISKVAGRVNDSLVHGSFPIDAQRAFSLEVLNAIGFNFERGRLDIAVHPFAINFSRNDVRLTTRYDENWLNPALFGSMHEAGHGMYEQGVATALDGTILGSGTSLSVHESQSRLWENLVGRSRGFWTWALPIFKQHFPHMAHVTLDELYKAINMVERSFIRVEADEATYNLHIMLRFELENDLLNGRVAIKDLPREWNGRFEQFFGITPPSDAIGVLQDVHWSAGLIGYFPTYALGNLLSVQYFNQAVKDNPSIPSEIEAGKFDTLLTWLQTNIHQHGRKFNTDELTKHVTGEGINSAPYIAYLQKKFGDIYGL
jgi:carboxypeptidase Taq